MTSINKFVRRHSVFAGLNETEFAIIVKQAVKDRYHMVKSLPNPAIYGRTFFWLERGM
jgi:hypothetical protein